MFVIVRAHAGLSEDGPGERGSPSISMWFVRNMLNCLLHTFSQLKDSVCSPAGTAIQGVRLLERAGFRGILMDAVHAASKRALELSRLENGEAKDNYVKR